ncbi:MAG: ABC transporter ATP-binding protein [Chloroflexi bacterium]|nr:ABC transporter ATP-binding protein [Chloroflexota bacterium]
MMMTSLELDHLTYDYRSRSGAVRAVDDLSLTVASGELLALLGPSGSGKTTTLRLIAGLLRPAAGDVRFDGASALRLPPERRGAVMVFQSHLLFPFMSVGDNVAFGLRMRGCDRETIRRRVAEALALVRLPGFENRWPDELSGGERQRVALARALAVGPRLLLLDEPLSNLDAPLREELRAEFVALQKRVGITTIFVTHDQAEAVAVADRIALIFAGRLAQVSEPRAFYERPANAEVARFFGGVNFIPARKHGTRLETSFGPLEIGFCPLPDGPVIAIIRPEAIELTADGDNTLEARVTDYTYRGLIARCQARVDGLNLQVAAPPHTRYAVGDTVRLHLPKERIWLLPWEETR